MCKLDIEPRFQRLLQYLTVSRVGPPRANHFSTPRRGMVFIVYKTPLRGLLHTFPLPTLARGACALLLELRARRALNYTRPAIRTGDHISIWLHVMRNTWPP
jgi:hypothetical protein